MAFNDFPFCEFLTHGDTAIYIEYPDGNTCIIPAKEIILWKEHGCNCESCEHANTVMDSFLIHGVKRIPFMTDEFSIIWINAEPPEEILTSLMMLGALGELKPIP